MLNAREFKLSLPDYQADCVTFGKGEKPLVMIQGLSTRKVKGTSIPLAYMYRVFAKDYTVCLFDRWENVPEGITVQDLAKDTASAMDSLNIKNADVIGVSQGGMIAQYLAIQRPDLVNKLVLAVTLSRINSTVESMVNKWTELTRQGDMKELVADMAEKMYSDEYVKRYKPLFPVLTIMQKSKNPRRFINLAKACLTCDTYGQFDRIKCPVFCNRRAAG